MPLKLFGLKYFFGIIENCFLSYSIYSRIVLQVLLAAFTNKVLSIW